MEAQGMSSSGFNVDMLMIVDVPQLIMNIPSCSYILRTYTYKDCCLLGYNAV
jgi:hypothetical protein